MKKSILSGIICLSFTSKALMTGAFAWLFVFNMQVFAQTNTFPSSGNVGVGTTSPSKELEVIGTIKADTVLFPDGTKISSGLFSRGLGTNSIMNNLAGSNSANSQYSFIGAGHNNLIQSNAQYGIIMGGSSNQIQNVILSQPIYNFIGNGSNNITTHSAKYSYVLNGQNNTVGDDYSMVLNGINNLIEDPIGNETSHNLITSGTNNTIRVGAVHSAIIGGSANIVQNGISNAVILGGTNVNATTSNTVYVPQIAFGDGSIQNTAVDLNYIGAPANYAGDFSVSYTAHTLVDKAYVDNKVAQGGGGGGLFTSGTGFRSVMNNLSGSNSAQAPSSFIGSGSGNIVQANAEYGIILGGTNNQLQNAIGNQPFFNLIGSGTNNTVMHNAHFSAILTGDHNLVDDDHSVIVSGAFNSIQSPTALPSSYNFISSGNNNTIGADAHHSSIIGGSGNTIAANVANTVILGGSARTATVSDAVYVPKVVFPDNSIQTTAGVTQNSSVTFSTLAVSSFAGTGDREVLVDANGNLKYGPISQALTDPWVLGGNDITADPAAFLGTTNPADLVFKTEGQERMRIYNAGDHPGNVGIGTSIPEKKLHIKTYHTVSGASEEGTHGGMRLEDEIFDSDFNTTTNNVWDVQTYGKTTFAIRKPGQDPLMIIQNNGYVGIGTIAAGAKLEVKGSGITNATTALNVTNNNGTSQLIVKDNGNVGIGITNPSTKLDVSGTINATQYTLNGGPLIASQWQASPANANDIYYDGGKVGIGTQTPQQQFEVNGGATSNTFARIGNNNGRADIGFNGSNGIIDVNQGALLINYYSSKNVGIGGGPNGPADLNVSGNVNVGSYNDVNTGTIKMQSKNAKLKIEDTDDFVNCEIQAAGGFTRILSNRELGIFLDSDDNEFDETFRVVTNSSFFGGNIRYLFSVHENGDAEICGTFRTKKLRVETNFCDFVFAEDYQRMPWQAKELYYKTHKHLPYVDPERTILAEGMDVGAMVKGMMQNVEEDRLDITELFKRIEKLEKENETLKNEISGFKNNK